MRSGSWVTPWADRLRKPIQNARVRLGGFAGLSRATHHVDPGKILDMRKRKTYEQWLLEADGDLEKEGRWFAKLRVPERKMPLLIDENLDRELIPWLDEARCFHIHTLPKGRSDEQLWQFAVQNQYTIVTADEDFADDRRYPIHRSPGVVIVKGTTLEDKMYALAGLWGNMDITAYYSKLGPDFLAGSKTRTNRSGAAHRFHDSRDGSVVSLRLEW